MPGSIAARAAVRALGNRSAAATTTGAQAGISSLRSLLLMAFHPTHLPSISSRAQSIGGAQIRLARPSDAPTGCWDAPIKRTPSLYIKCSSRFRRRRRRLAKRGAHTHSRSGEIGSAPFIVPIGCACWMFAPQCFVLACEPGMCLIRRPTSGKFAQTFLRWT